jgi:hypothetical protein
VINVLEAARAGAGPRQPVGLRARQLPQQLLALGPGVDPVDSGVLPIPGRLLPIPGRPLAIGCRERSRVCRRDTIARQRHHIASAGDLVAGVRRLGPNRRAVPALLSRAIASVTRPAMRFGVAAAREVAIAGRLVAIGRGLVAIRRELVAVRPDLIIPPQRLILISPRLIALTRQEHTRQLALPIYRAIGPADDTLAPDTTITVCASTADIAGSSVSRRLSDLATS